MSIYMTEDEQLDAIKRWWKRYNGVVTVAISVVLLVISGFKYWNFHQEKITQQASGTYERMMVAFSNEDNKAVRGYANQLVTDYGKTVYADAARLTLAKHYVVREQFDKARDELSYVALHTKMPALKYIAKLRLARLWLQQNEHVKALHQLETIQDPTYAAIVNELKGDIYAAQGQNKKAVSFYRHALKEVHAKGMNNPFLDMKANELAALQ